MELFPKNKIIVATAGLPGKGKTFIAKKIARYIDWLGLKSEVFNTCKYRRDMYAGQEFNAEFFNPDNTASAETLNECSERATEDLIRYLKDGGDVAVFDGTNETTDKRTIFKRALDEGLSSYNLIWVESIYENDTMIQESIKTTVSSSPDYKDMDAEIAVEDYTKRIEYCKKYYQEITKESEGSELSFIKIHDFGSQVVVNNVSGYVESKIISLLMHIHNQQRTIYFSRHGESMNNIADKVGGNPDLSERGYAYSKNLNLYFQDELKQKNINQDTKMFCSQLQRTIITAGAIDVGIKAVPLKTLNELYSGTLEDMTYAEISEKFPQEAAERKKDKLRYRYPGGESYMDVCQRVEPVLFAIEKSREPVIIVAHQAVIRCLYAYFCQENVEEIPHLSVPLHTVIKLVPETYHIHETRYGLERTRQETYEKKAI